MAVAATGVVIYDPLDGSNDNAGYFDKSLENAGTDYPRAQAAAILTATDLACATGGTTLTSATGGFTDAMIGNGIYIKSGTNFTVGLYVITARVDTNTVTLDRDPTDGSDASSGAGSVGGRRAVLLDAWLETPYNVAGMTHEVWATATMTLTEDVSVVLVATEQAPITIRGMSSAGVASPEADNRPLIACGSCALMIATFWNFVDIRLTGTYSPVLKTGSFVLVRNCKVTSSGGSTGIAFLSNGTGVRVVDCEVMNDQGNGVRVTGDYPRLLLSYIHDCGREGVQFSNGGVVIGCVINNCGTRGIYLLGSDRRGTLCMNNTINGCADGLQVDTHYGAIFMNNIISNCTSEGAVATDVIPNNYWDYNDFFGNAIDRTYVDAGPHDNDVDPGYTNAAAGDFSTGVNVADTGFGIRLGVG